MTAVVWVLEWAVGTVRPSMRARQGLGSPRGGRIPTSVWHGLPPSQQLALPITARAQLRTAKRKAGRQGSDACL